MVWSLHFPFQVTCPPPDICPAKARTHMQEDTFTRRRRCDSEDHTTGHPRRGRSAALAGMQRSPGLGGEGGLVLTHSVRRYSREACVFVKMSEKLSRVEVEPRRKEENMRQRLTVTFSREGGIVSRVAV